MALPMSRPRYTWRLSQDTISPHADQQVMLGAMPQAVAREIPEAGHLSAVEQPSAINDVLLEVLSDWQ